MSPSVQYDECVFYSEKEKASLFKIRKNIGREYSSPEFELFEVKTYTSLVSLLSNKRITNIEILKPFSLNKELVFSAFIENGIFKDVVDVEDRFNKLLCINSKFFYPFINSAQRFYDSITIKEGNYSVAFVLLVFALETISNILYKYGSKRRKLIRFVNNYIESKKFTQTEIRQLEFSGVKKNINLLFNKLLSHCYQFRCGYVHDGEMISILSLIADKLSMAFISNDQITVFPSYSWLRRISNLTLINFLDQNKREGKNSFRKYFEPYEIKYFKTKKAVQKGQPLNENDIYLQQLSKGFYKE